MTPAPDFRALCAELLDELQYQTSYETNAENCAALQDRARAALATPLGPPKNCWLDDEPDLCPSPCVFDDPSEVISNCTFAQTIKCKTDCQYYRVATPPPEPPPLKLKRSGGYQPLAHSSKTISPPQNP
jgi:hypothetical protein